MGWWCFFGKKKENGGVFSKKSGHFLNAGCIMYSISIFLFYILLIWVVHTHPTHPPPAYGPDIIAVEMASSGNRHCASCIGALSSL